VSWVTSWWEVVIIVAVVLGSGLIGAVVGMHRARRDDEDWPEPLPATSYLERRAAVYLDVAIGWHAYLEAVRPLAVPAAGFASDRPRDLAAVLRSRVQLEQFGTIATQGLHDEALEVAVTLITTLRSLPRSASTGVPDLGAGRWTLRSVLRELATKVDQLERQMSDELQPAPPPLDFDVEIMGRAGIAQRPIGAKPAETGPRR
jgi:hypothetical protein